VTLSASFSKSFSSFTASRHFDLRMRFYSEFNENDKILLQILDFNARDKIVFFRTLTAAPLRANHISVSKLDVNSPK